MKIRNPFLIRLLGFLASWVLRFWVSTISLKLVNLDGTPHPADHRRQRFLYSIWHENILFLAHFRTRIHVLISHHSDGEFITRTAQHWGAKVVRGSTNRGGSQALLQLIKISQSSHLLVTPDGPRGPRRRVQIGLIFLASHTGLPIVPVAVGYRHAWRANSWDRFVLPRPFTTAYGLIGQAIHIPKKTNRKTLEAYRDLVEQRMQELSDTAERRAAGKPARATPEIREPQRIGA